MHISATKQNAVNLFDNPVDLRMYVADPFCRTSSLCTAKAMSNTHPAHGPGGNGYEMQLVPELPDSP